ncbi:cytochrome P450 [Pyxidicoccus parkwayensis]|uniref:Cytochrome P450 n=1 Tax=Pyxidicoccus parkwayensis TaxID=2813578 RepID=A0ABX7NYH2_9BACT|nr:cytochrome P450 [Pyxidicoccus parkwaysis]QSQ23763.1 cytochrome P450 [Pyxidicoccus parkwaysis]
MTTPSPKKPVLPPGHHGHWLLGLNEHVKDPLGALVRAQRKHGDIAYFNTQQGPLYMLAHPDHAQRVLVDNARNYPAPDKRPSRLLGNGIFQSNGAFWLRQRRMVQPAFHRSRLVRMVEDLVLGTEALAERWEPSARSGEPLELLEQMRLLVPTLLGASLFSRGVYERDAGLQASVAFLSHKSHGSARDSLWKLALRRLGYPRSRRQQFDAATDALNASLYGLIAARRQAPSAGDDILGMLLEARDTQGEGMTDTEVRDELVSLLVGGHEATSVALTWTWYTLLSHPDVEQRVREELASVLGGRPPSSGEALQGLHYTRAVVEETLRLYPPAWQVMRRAQEDDEIAGFTVRAGSLVILPTWLLHRHASFWKDPERFQPERFLPEQKEQRHRHAWLPFGGGQRMCVGNGYTLTLILAVLATLLPRFQVRLVPGHPVTPVASNTYRPRFGLKATLHPAPAVARNDSPNLKAVSS